MELLEIRKRHRLLEMTAAWIAKSYEGKEEALALVTNPEALFTEFKMRLREAATVFHEHLIVVGVVHYTLSSLVSLCDITVVEDRREQLGQLIDNLQKDNAQSARINDFVSHTMDNIISLPEQTEGYYLLYRYFCENLVQSLLDEYEPTA